jgi:hypothetical protein
MAGFKRQTCLMISVLVLAGHGRARTDTDEPDPAALGQSWEDAWDAWDKKNFRFEI